MMRIRRAAGLFTIVGLLWSSAGGCYRSPDTTWHEPHVYKGSEDPLLPKLDAGVLQPDLQERFRAVQTDR